MVIHWRGDGSSYLLHPQTSRVPRFAFGKYRGHTVDEVMRVESSCLVWFLSKIEGCEELKEAIEGASEVPRRAGILAGMPAEEGAAGGMAAGAVLPADHRRRLRELFKPEEEKGL